MTVYHQVVGVGKWLDVVVYEYGAADAVFLVEVVIEIEIQILLVQQNGIVYVVSDLYPAYQITVLSIEVNELIQYLRLLLFDLVHLLRTYGKAARGV